MEVSHPPVKTIDPLAELNIYKIVGPIYWISRLGGMLPFKFNANGDSDHVVVTLFDKIWFVISLSRYCVLSYLCIAVSLNDYLNESSAFLYAASNFILFLGLLHGIFTISKNMIQRELIWRCLHDLDVCDKQLHALGVRLNYRKHKIVIILIFVTLFICASTFIAITGYAYRAYHVPSRAFAMAIFYASYSSKSSIFSANLLIYIFKMLSVRQRYRHLNKLIRFGHPMDSPCRNSTILRFNCHNLGTIF